MKTGTCLSGEIADKCSILLQVVTAAGINDMKRIEHIFSAKWDNPREYLKELIITECKQMNTQRIKNIEPKQETMYLNP